MISRRAFLLGSTSLAAVAVMPALSVSPLGEIYMGVDLARPGGDMSALTVVEKCDQHFIVVHQSLMRDLIRASDRANYAKIYEKVGVSTGRFLGGLTIQ
jgi:hypothetical protein